MTNRMLHMRCIRLAIALAIASAVALSCLVHGVHGDCTYDKSALTLLTFHLSGGGAVQMEIDANAIARLNSISSRIAVVSIIGPYRTGKSTLLNQLLPDDVPKGVFSVGHTVQPHTEEVSMYIVPPCALEGKSIAAETSLIFMDTPGLFAPNRAAIFDAQLLAILNLLSSAVMYNNFGVIKRGEVEQLSDAIEAAFALSYYDDADDSANKIDRPHLIWCMQNLQVELKDRNNQDISPKTYIQSILNEIDQSANGTTSYSYKFNKFFASLDAFGVPYPTDSMKDANRINELADAQLTEEYRRARTLLRGKLMNVVTPKKLGKNLLIGSSMANLLQTWLDNVNLPLSDVRTKSASTLLKHINAKEVAKALERYKSEMKKLSFPVEDRVLSDAHNAAVKFVFSGINIVDLPEFVADVTTETNALFISYVALNENNIKGVLEEQATKAEAEYERRIREWIYPSTQAKIAALEEEIVKAFLSAVDPVKASAAAFVTTYEQRIRDKMSANRGNMLQQSALAYKENISKQLEMKAAAMMLPQDESVIEDAVREALSQWAQVASDLSGLSPSVFDPIKMSFHQHIDDARTALLQRNLEASNNQCQIQAQKIVREIRADVDTKWLTHPAYKSYRTFDDYLSGFTHKPFCVGRGHNSSDVAFMFYRLQRQVHDDIAYRVFIARILLFVSGCAVVAVIWSMYTIIYSRKLQGALGLHRYIGWIAGALAVGIIIIWTFVPDAITSDIELLALFAFAALITGCLVGAYNEYRVCTFSKESQFHEH